ncbi:tRNA uridine-5-carboxymethylaminomethyl(34) synthesis GTPase MnmE [Entomobacter blattae]|uniref:tRNA uridine-5-carboxymethylaminomethyl(34) synthesis GTPase MnmE n=1 Tax=Entomobacter blattae TaxID=2762277 RepID=UPI00193C7D98
MSSFSTTIFALATGAARGAIAVMRISGPESLTFLERLCYGGCPAPRRASVRKIFNPKIPDDMIDEALILTFKGPASYTGEDCAELHLHASPAVIEAVAEGLVFLGALPAEPGEFSRRAFMNGRLDLVQAEGIADLIAAETQGQRRQALQQAQGKLSTVYQDWAQRLKKILSWQEALIDFPDEELPDEVERQLKSEITQLGVEFSHHLAEGRRGELVREGLVFAIVGAPNAGKSSLLNYLAGRPAAIVSSQAGTTRDAIEIRIEIADVPVTLVDTAGLRETGDEIEAEGIKRAHAYMQRADLIIYLIAPQDPLPLEVPAEALLVYSKVDLAPPPIGCLGISIREKMGLEEFYQELTQRTKTFLGPATQPPLTRVRHRAGIERAYQHLARAGQDGWPETRGEELRLALQALGQITGKVGVEEILDSIFGEFCIGK